MFSWYRARHSIEQDTVKVVSLVTSKIQNSEEARNG